MKSIPTMNNCSNQQQPTEILLICIYVRMGGFRGFRMDSESQGFQPLLRKC